MPNRQLAAADAHRARLLHLERLAAIESRPRPASSAASRGTVAASTTAALRAGAGPARPWAQPPPRKPTFVKPPPMTKVLGSRPAKLSFEQQEHQRHVAALFSRLQRVHLGVEWRQREHAERAQAAGRARISSAPTRRRTQVELEQQNATHMHRLRKMPARFASPHEIALLAGKPVPGAAVAGGGGGADDVDE